MPDDKVNKKLRDPVLKKHAKLAIADATLREKGRLEADFEDEVKKAVAQAKDAGQGALEPLNREEIGYCLGWLRANSHLDDKGLKQKLEDAAKGGGPAGG